MKLYIYKIICLGLAGLMFGCSDFDYKPVDQLANEEVLNSPELLSNVTIGTYSRLRELNYVRNRHGAQEFPGDDAVWVKNSGDHRMFSYSYQHIVNSTVSTNFWQQAYQGIYAANVVIEAIPDDEQNPELLQMKGENLFLRAFMHYDLVRIFSRPFSQDPDSNLGIMIRDNTDVSALPPRSTVREAYEFIEADLLKAASLMTEAKSSIFASKEVAYALLSRLYLYMEENEKAIEYADKVIDSGRYGLLPNSEFGSYFTLLPESNQETIFAIKIQETENMGKGSIGSLYNGNGGWGEMFASSTYRDLLYQNPNDARIMFITPDYVLDSDGNKIVDLEEDCGYKVNMRDGKPKYYINKYTDENGVQMLSSPIILKLSEMYLNKAEAYAKLPGHDSDAIKLVNIIRKRAGLSNEKLFTTSDLKGYESVLDVVLDERRLEMAWEGHRSFDVFRNNKSLDRSFIQPFGWSGKDLIQPSSLSIVHLIPESEMALNRNLTQNPTE